MKLKSIKQFTKIKQKKILLRLDLNAPIKNNKVLDDFRIKRSLPTIKYLLKNKAQIIIISHLGRPEGKKVKSLSLKPVYLDLRKKLRNQSLQFIKEDINLEKTRQKINCSKKSIIFLENLRYYPGEKKNSLDFAKNLAKLADCYVNDAFAVCHRRVASVCAVTKYLKSYAGLNLLDEVKFLSKALKPRKPAVAIIGGVKIKSKFSVIKNLQKKYNKIIPVGGVANLFLAAQNYQVGSSVLDEKFLSRAKIIFNKKIILPQDFVVADKKTKRKVRYQKLIWGKNLCGQNEMILDLGPMSQENIMKILTKTKTIVWAGPVGFIEDKLFAHASEQLAKFLAYTKNKTVIVGGGETISVVNKLKLQNKMTFVSTGGGAMLEFLTGDTLPGLLSLINKK